MIILWSVFLYKDLGVKGKLIYPSILLLLQVASIRHSFFSASNDGLFVFFLSLMFIFLYRGVVAKSGGVKMFALAGFFMAASLSVRELLVFYVPGIAMVLIVAFYLNKNNALGILSLCLTFILSLLLIHYPSIKERGSLSFHDKNPDGRLNWAEGNYYEVMKGRHGIVHSDELAQFKKKYGDNALPKSYFQAMVKTPVLTAKKFFRQLYYSQLPFIRQLGLLYVVFMVMGVWTIFNRKILQGNFWIIFFFYVTYLISFSLIVLRHVEFRWFIIFPFAFTVFSIGEWLYEKCNRYALVEAIFYLNLCSVTLANSLLLGIW